jgi:hypothetical protein
MADLIRILTKKVHDVHKQPASTLLEDAYRVGGNRRSVYTRRATGRPLYKKGVTT